LGAKFVQEVSPMQGDGVVPHEQLD
jgi:hypothetical protein